MSDASPIQNKINSQNPDIPKFNIYLSDQSNPKACILQMLGYEITDGNIYGGLLVGDNIKEVTNSNNDLITNCYSHRIVIDNYILSLKKFLVDYKSLGRECAIVWEGYSFGSFLILYILDKANRDDLEIVLSQVERIRLQGTFYGIDFLGFMGQILNITNRIFPDTVSHLHSRYLVRLSILFKWLFLQLNLRFNRGYNSKKEYFIKRLLSSYDWRAVENREDLMFSIKSLLGKDYERSLKSIKVKPRITLITSTRDYISPYVKLLKLYNLLTNANFNVKLIFIEKIDKKTNNMVYNDILKRVNLISPKVNNLFIIRTNKKWDGHFCLHFGKDYYNLIDKIENLPDSIGEENIFIL
jgi:hypothetical protein